jgi:hypothetical protein
VNWMLSIAESCQFSAMYDHSCFPNGDRKNGWKLSSVLTPHNGHWSVTSNVLLHLFLQVGRESVASLHAKCCIFGGTLHFQIRSHIYLSYHQELRW